MKQSQGFFGGFSLSTPEAEKRPKEQANPAPKKSFMKKK
jgi:hypothetical protein